MCLISPSGLTRCIQRFEEEVGVSLFQRDNRKVSLTPDGLRLQKYGDRILDTWEHFTQGLESNTYQLQGVLEIYCSVTASYSLLRPIINKFRQTHPRIHLRLQTGEAAAAITKVVNGEADLCITSRPNTLPAQLVFKEQIQIPLVLIAPNTPCHVQKKLKEKEPWHSLPLILPRHGLARKWINAHFREKKIRPEIYADIAGNEAIIAMVGLGCGIGLVPKLVLMESSHYKEVTVLKTGLELPPYRVGFCTRENKLKSRIVQAFWEMIPMTSFTKKLE